MTSTGALEERYAEETELDNTEELESEVNAMARKIMEYRCSLPEQLKARFASLMEAHRPVIKLPHSGTGAPALVARKDGALRVLDEECEKEAAEKIHELKQKVSKNASAMPIVLKRMNQCIARIDMLDSRKFAIDPMFKRKRSNDQPVR